MKVQSENYITIQGFMRTELGLTGNDLLVYAIIYGVSQDRETKFSGSLQYLADWCGATKHGILKNLKNLLDRNLIIKDETMINGVKFVTYRVTELHTMQQSYTNNSISNTQLDNNTNKQQVLLEDTNKEDTYNKDRKKFVDDYNSICVSLPKCIKLTPKRIRGINNLLKKYSYEDILTVFRKLEASDFCTNRKGTGWKADLDFILREEKFVKTLEGGFDNKRSSGRTGRSIETTSLKDGEVARVVTQEEKEELRRMVERGELEEY